MMKEGWEPFQWKRFFGTCDEVDIHYARDELVEAKYFYNRQ
jgi:hypothetical protein